MNNKSDKVRSIIYQPLKLNRSALFVLTNLALLYGLYPIPLFAKEFFPPGLLEMTVLKQEEIDLSAYEINGTQVPGTYRVDIVVSSRFVESNDITFFQSSETNEITFYERSERTGRTTLQPCLSIEDLARLKVKTELFPDLKTEDGCANLSAIPNAFAEFDFEHQKLNLSIPQAALRIDARGHVAPERWENGITAAVINYSYSGSHMRIDKGHDKTSNNQYLNLRPGVNIGSWRFRNYTIWNKTKNSSGKWDNVYTYIQRGITELKSQLTLGDGNSPSDIFSSVPFRGIQLASDDEMIPESLRGYAPSVRGVARTNAQVVIKQNGYTIYQTYVAPGAFVINDMYPTGGSGDLEVTVIEADGSEQHFTVPFASLPVLQREGRLKYSFTGGEYRAYDSDINKTYFGQFTAIYGLPKDMSVYGGVQLAEKGRYKSAALGVGKNLGAIGAISADVTQSWARIDDKEQSGQSLQVRYGKNIADTGTNITIAGYRYSTNGFYTLNEALDSYRSDNYGHVTNTERRRNRTEITLNQRLWWENAGTLSLYMINEDYWKSKRRSHNVGVGYSNSWKGISYGVNYTYYRNSSNNNDSRIYNNDQMFSFNVNVPLSGFVSNSRVNYHLTTDKKGNTTNSLSLNGTALEGNNLYWNVQETYSNRNSGVNSSVDLTYRGSYGETMAGYSYSSDMQRINYGVNGGIVLHEDGITLGQQLSDTAILVKAPGAGNVDIASHPGVATDFRGYTIVPYASPYRENTVNLNTETLPNSVDFTEASQVAVPTRGAIARVNFKPRIGQRALIILTQKNGIPVPFGASVTLSSRTEEVQSAIVGNNGQVYLSGVDYEGSLRVIWGTGKAQQCKANYRLPEKTDESGIFVSDAECV